MTWMLHYVTSSKQALSFWPKHTNCKNINTMLAPASPLATQTTKQTVARSGHSQLHPPRPIPLVPCRADMGACFNQLRTCWHLNPQPSSALLVIRTHSLPAHAHQTSSKQMEGETDEAMGTYMSHSSCGRSGILI